MNKKTSTHINNRVNPLLKVAVVVSIMIFTHFTFAIQYVNLNGSGLSLTEIVEEEEEKEEHNQDILELLVNNSNVIRFLTLKVKENIIETHVIEVSTPPPEFS